MRGAHPGILMGVCGEATRLPGLRKWAQLLGGSGLSELGVLVADVARYRLGGIEGGCTNHVLAHICWPVFGMLCSFCEV